MRNVPGGPRSILRPQRCAPGAARRRFLIGAGAGAAWLGLGLAAQAQQTQAGPRIDFAIPAQDLRSALERFSETSGVQLLYAAQHAEGHVSTPLEGAYDAREGLSVLLEGTGLGARFTDDIAAVLFPLVDPAASATLLLETSNGGEAHAAGRLEVRDALGRRTYENYVRLVLSEMRAALERDRQTSMRAYSIRVQLWLTNSGRVDRFELLHGSGNERLDRAIGVVLAQLTVRQEPPLGLPQPLRMGVEARATRSGEIAAMLQPSG